MAYPYQLWKQRYRHELRKQVLVGYGHKCKCCGESRWQFLAVDHVDGGAGSKQKRYAKGETGQALHLKILRENFPDRYRLLCHNCNQARGYYGRCPHEDEHGDRLVP